MLLSLTKCSSTNVIVLTDSLMPDPLFVLYFDVLTFTLKTSLSNALVRVSKSRDVPKGEGDLDSFVANIRMGLYGNTVISFGDSKIHPLPEGDGLLLLGEIKNG